MTDTRDPLADLLSDLLGDAVSDVEPTDALPAIRARTAAPGRRRTGAYAGGSVLVVAAVVTVVALLAGGPGRPAPDPQVATTRATDPASTGSTSGPAEAVYYVGDTPAGPRLYREFRPAASSGTDPLALLSETPQDPDYRTLWPAGSLVTAHREAGTIVVELGEARVPDPGVTAAEGRLAVQQVVYTVQAAYQVRLPVRFTQGGADVDQVYGVDTTEPVTNRPQLEVLSHMNISTPSEGEHVSGTLAADGVSNGFEASVILRIEQDGVVVQQDFAQARGWAELRLYAWRTDAIDISGLPPGTYTLVAETDNPATTEGFSYSDTRTFVVD